MNFHITEVFVSWKIEDYAGILKKSVRNIGVKRKYALKIILMNVDG